MTEDTTTGEKCKSLQGCNPSLPCYRTDKPCARAEPAPLDTNVTDQPKLELRPLLVLLKERADKVVAQAEQAAKLLDPDLVAVGGAWAMAAEYLRDMITIAAKGPCQECNDTGFPTSENDMRKFCECVSGKFERAWGAMT